MKLNLLSPLTKEKIANLFLIALLNKKSEVGQVFENFFDYIDNGKIE